MNHQNSAPERPPDLAAALQKAKALLHQRATRLTIEALVAVLRTASFDEFRHHFLHEFPELVGAPRTDLEEAYRAMRTSVKAQLAIVSIPHWVVGTA